MRRHHALAAAAALLLAGCGSEGPRTVTLLTHDSFDVSEDVLAAFEDEHGLRVEVVPLGDAGAALNIVALTADDPGGDVLFGVDSTFLTRALAADVFLPHVAADLDAVDPAFLPPDDRVTPVDFGDVCVNYDVAWFAARDLAVPRTLTDLADPAYRGLLAVQNPATSSPGLAFLLGTIERLGEAAAFDLWADLRANDLLVTDGWTDAYYGAFTHAGGGDRPLVVSYASSPPAEVLFAEEPLDAAPTGVLLETCHRQIEYAGVLRGARDVEAARLLVDLLISPAFQADLPTSMFVFPVRTDVALPEVFAAHAVLPDRPVVMEPARVDAGREAWIARFDAVVLR
ncbi:MAG: TbpA [Actinomycetota bacterium]|jgi:thiamine transport system substrate-binding protein